MRYLVVIDNQGSYLVFDEFEKRPEDGYPGCTLYKTNERDLVLSSGENPYDIAFDSDESDGELHFLSNNGPAVGMSNANDEEQAVIEILFAKGFT